MGVWWYRGGGKQTGPHTRGRSVRSFVNTTMGRVTVDEHIRGRIPAFRCLSRRISPHRCCTVGQCIFGSLLDFHLMGEGAGGECYPF